MKRILKFKFSFILKIIFIAVLYFSQFNSAVMADPPDKPLRPQEWVEKMGNGNWMIFNIEPDDFTFADVKYSPQILDTLLSIGQTGGRLHFRPRAILDSSTFTYDTAAVNFLSKMIDDMTERGMAVCLQYNPLWGEEEKDMTSQAKAIYFSTWEQLCSAFKDKSHLFAMSPVIETHVWQNLGDKDVMRDSLNWLYDSLTVIFRKYNPTRIISYKPWGAAKKAELYTLAFPFKGNHADPDSGYYVGSFSGSYGMGNWEDYGIWQNYTLDQLLEQMMHAGKLDKPDFGIAYAVRWREQTGIQIWIDHWEPDYWKDAEWTDEQNLVYTDYLLDTLKALGIASSGPQTRRLWDNDNNRLFNDDFTRKFIEILKEHDWRVPVSLKNNNSNRQLLHFSLKQNYPNPFNPLTTIEYYLPKSAHIKISVYNVLGEKVNVLLNKRDTAGYHTIKFNAGGLASGVYLCKLEAGEFVSFRKMILMK